MIRKIDYQIFSNTTYQVVGKFITSGLAFIATIFLARYLGVVNFGQYNLIFVFLGLFSIFADFGLGTILIREVAAGRADNNYFAAIFTLRSLFCILIFVVICLCLPFLPYSLLVKQGIILGFVGFSLLSLSSIFWAVFQARLKFIKIVFVKVVSGFFSFGLILLGIKLNLPFLFFVLVSVGENFLGFLISLKIFTDYRKRFLLNRFMFKRIFFDVWPIGLATIVSTLYFKIDSFLLSLFFHPEKYPDLGIYSAAYRYFEVVSVFAGFFHSSAFPVISANLKKGNFKLIYRRLLIYASIIGFLSAFCLYVFSSKLILLLGREYFPAIYPLRILSLALGISVFFGVWLSVGVAGGEQKRLFGYSVIALLINLLSNLWIIPKYSFIGASWTTVLTQLFIGLTNYLVARRVVSRLWR